MASKRTGAKKTGAKRAVTTKAGARKRGGGRTNVAESPVSPYSAAGRTPTIGAAAFKAHCLALIDKVRNKGESIVITKRGVPVAKLVPVDEHRPKIFGYMRGSVLWYGDLISPIDVKWDAMED